MKKVLGIIILGALLILGAYYAFIYFVPYSEGVRTFRLVL